MPIPETSEQTLAVRPAAIRRAEGEVSHNVGLRGNSFGSSRALSPYTETSSINIWGSSMETPLEVLSRAASFVHANEEDGEAALRADPRLHSLSLSSSSSSSSSSLSSSSSSSVSSHRTGPPPISPTKRKLSGDQGDSDLDDNEHVAKMSRLFATQLKPNGDYRSPPVVKDRSRSPIGSVVVPGALGIHGNHLYSPHPHHHHHHHHHHLVSLAGMDQPLALTKNSMVESARSGTAVMATVPHAGGAAERQQNRPSVITCAPANNRNCNLSHCPVSHNSCSSLGSSYRRMNTNTACDPVIEEHFRRSLGKNYKEPEPVATNSLSITGSVDDHFAKALGETWLQIKNKGSPSSSSSSPNSSPDTRMLAHSHSPSVLS